MTQRVEPLFQGIWFKELNLSCFQCDVTQRNEPFFLKMSQLIEPLFHMNYFFTWLKELNCFSIWLIWLKQLNLVFKKRLKELNLFLWTSFHYDSKSWTFLLSIWRKELETFFNMTNMTQTIENVCQKKRLKELNLFFMNLFSIWLKELNLFLNMTQRNWTFFSKYDAENWTFFLMRRKKIDSFFFQIWLTEFEFFWYDSKKWTFFFWIWLQSIEPSSFWEFDSKKWTFWTLLRELIFSQKKWLKELNLFLFWKMSQIIEVFFSYDSKNWTSFQCVWMKWTHLIDDSQNWTLFGIWLTELNFFWMRLTAF